MRDQIEGVPFQRRIAHAVGLEEKLDHQQIADLISFIKNWRYLEGRVPLTPPVQK